MMLHWSGVDMAARGRGLMRAVAYATRYGHIGLVEALSCDVSFLRRFNDALESIVKEENGK